MFGADQTASMASSWIKILPIRMGCCSNTNCSNRFRCDGNTNGLMLPHYYRVRQRDSCHRFGEVARRSSWAIKLSALCLYSNINNSSKYLRCGAWYWSTMDCLYYFKCNLTTRKSSLKLQTSSKQDHFDSSFALRGKTMPEFMFLQSIYTAIKWTSIKSFYPKNILTVDVTSPSKKFIAE